MTVLLAKDFSVGLAHSQLSSGIQRYGTGLNLRLEIEFQTTIESADVDKRHWREFLNQMVQELDHVHLQLDHPLLKNKNISELELVDWIINEAQVRLGLGLHAQLRQVSLRSDEDNIFLRTVGDGT